LGGPNVYEQKVRSEAEKASDLATEFKEKEKDKDREKEVPARKTRGKGALKEEVVAKSEGPTVVKVNRGRKLVAAGLAEIAEIQAELEAPSEAEEGEDQESKKGE
ncbi:MAG: hypothetical protein WCH11_02430, partial [Bdellovibrio sp.]